MGKTSSGQGGNNQINELTLFIKHFTTAYRIPKCFTIKESLKIR